MAKRRKSESAPTEAPSGSRLGSHPRGGPLVTRDSSETLGPGPGPPGEPPKFDLIARAIRYLGLFLYIIIVYGGLLLTDYALLGLVGWLVRDEIASHPILAMFFDSLKVGLALFIMVGALIHGFLSLITLIKLDFAVAKELEDNETRE
jgi:hypothetical protein